MARKIFTCVMLFATLIIILALCVAISPKEREIIVNNEKVAYITFDDGPSKNTARILKVLDTYKIKATFFVVGNLIDEDYGKQLRKMEENGHKIGIHSYTHDYDSIYSSKRAFMEDFYRTKKTLGKYLKKETKIYRFPGGSSNCFMDGFKEDVIKTLEKEKYSYYDWNVSGEDSLNCPDVDEIIYNVCKDYSKFDRPIILLHDGSQNDNTVYALTGIINNLKKSGYSFGVLD